MTKNSNFTLYSFYKTYKEDAVILWELFKYKWNKDCIAFGILQAIRYLAH